MLSPGQVSGALCSDIFIEFFANLVAIVCLKKQLVGGLSGERVKVVMSELGSLARFICPGVYYPRTLFQGFFLGHFHGAILREPLQEV